MFSALFNELGKIIQQSMSGDDGKYSSKKLTMFIYAILGVVLALVDCWARDGKLNEYSFSIIVGMAIGQAGLALYGQKINKLIPNTTTTVSSVDQVDQTEDNTLQASSTTITTKTDN